MIVVPSKMGRMNKLALLTRMQRMGTASRADLAKSLGLSQPTCGKIVEEMLRTGVLESVPVATVEESDPAENGRRKLGRPGMMLRLNRTTPRFVGIELGVSHTRLAGLPLGMSGEDHWEATLPTPNSARAWVRALDKAAKSLTVQDPWGVLISAPGIVDEPRARVLFSPNLHWTERANLPDLVSEVWPVPGILIQEERALALGHQSVTPERDDFLLVDFGEGVGGAVIVTGKLQANPLPVSGELGHTPVLGNQRPCGCGGVGCLETLVSTRGLLESHNTAHPQVPQTWRQLAESLAQNGIEPWLASTLDATAVVIAGALNVIGLRHVVLTGSLTELRPAVVQYLTRAIRRGAMWARFGEVEVEVAPRRRTAGLVAVGIERLILSTESLGAALPGSRTSFVRSVPVLNNKYTPHHD